MLYSEPQTASQNNIYFASFEASVLPNLDNATLAGFRKGLREHAVSTAQKTLSAGALATETIVQMAALIQDMKAGLNRKEFGVFIKDLLQMVGDSARKYLDIAKAFEGFDLSRLVSLEPFTLLKLRTKRYAPVVEKLREQPVITPNLVQDLIKEVLPKQPRKKVTEPSSGWKQTRSGGGRYYNLLLHDEEIGLLIEQQAEAEGILPSRVIAEAVALRAQQKQDQVQVQVEVDPEEPDSNLEHDQAHLEEVEKDAPTASAEFAREQLMEQAMPPLAACPPGIAQIQSEQPTNNAIASDEVEEVAEVAIAQPEVSEYVAEQPAVIAVPPEALLAGEDRTEIEWLLNAPIGKVEEIIREVALRSAYRALYLLNRSESSDEKRIELLESRVNEYHISIGAVKPTEAITPVHTGSDSAEPTEVTGYLETEQKSLDKEPAYDECFVEKDVQSLSVEPHAGDHVEIVSDRHGENLVGQVGVVTVANNVGCVVEVADKTLWFCADEIVLALAATLPQALPEQEKEAITAASQVEEVFR